MNWIEDIWTTEVAVEVTEDMYELTSMLMTAPLENPTSKYAAEGTSIEANEVIVSEIPEEYLILVAPEIEH